MADTKEQQIEALRDAHADGRITDEVFEAMMRRVMAKSCGRRFAETACTRNAGHEGRHSDTAR